MTPAAVLALTALCVAFVALAIGGAYRAGWKDRGVEAERLLLKAANDIARASRSLDLASHRIDELELELLRATCSNTFSRTDRSRGLGCN